MIVGVPTKLNLIPSGVMPVVYINQGDAGYDKEFLIYNGDSAYNVPAGVSATIRGTKADGLGVTEAAAVTEGSNLVTVTITEQMVAAEGENLYELVFVDTNGLRVASINMVWAVKKDALGDSVISESDLDYATQVMNALQGVYAFKNQLDTNTSGLAAETAARITADNSLQTNINNEASARYSQDTLLQAQIDQLVSPTGTAPSAAEVENARIGIDGNVYSTLGDAVRGQATDLTNSLIAIENAEPIPFALKFTANKSISSTGHYGDNSYRIATKLYAPVTDAFYISYTVAEGYRIFGAFYDGQNDSSSFVSSFGWLTGSGIIEIPSTALFMRVSLASVNDASVLTVEDASKLTMTYESKYTFDIQNALVYRGRIDSVLNPYSTISEVTQIGLYNISTNVSLSDKPAGFDGGTLIVIPAYSTKSTITHETQLIQILISATSKLMLMRYNSSGGVWRDWVNIVEVAHMPVITEKTKWLAVGDSITYGVYSYIGSGGTAGSSVTSDCWVKLLASALNYDLTVMASRGMGYTVTGQDPVDSSLPRITIDTLLTRIEALTDDFNLITLAFGINDYATASSTVSAIETSFNSAVQRLLTKFPSARLVVITPFNSCRAGAAASNWAYNTATGNKTLKDIADAIKARCVAYGIEYIDASNGFLFNTFNIQGLEPDNTHPSLTGHKLIAKNMAHYLLN